MKMQKNQDSETEKEVFEGELVSAAAVAAFLKISLSTVTRWAQAKKFVSFKLGKRLLIQRQSVLDFVAKNKRM